ncbi:MAG: restriction endonuclease [Thermoanaerobaculia bacterium]
MTATKDDVPTFEKLINPTLRALHALGGSGSIQEIDDAVVADIGLPNDVAEVPHGRGSQTEVEYRAAWARNYLKNFGLIENSDRGVWALTPEGAKTQRVDEKLVVREVQRRQREAREAEDGETASDVEDARPRDFSWHSHLLQLLLDIPPAAFERLCQRILREAGFIEVEVKGRSGDGGIDGFGILRLGGFISFNVLFQSKRHRGNIGPDVVRDFRGAMVGRADMGLIITTASFTRDARKEATRDGAPPIDLIDGEQLVEKLKDLRLGVKVAMVESVEVNEDWFRSL